MDYIRRQPIEQLVSTFTQKSTITPIEVEDLQPIDSSTVYFHLELTGFQCLLRVRDGPLIVLGVETAGLKGDHVGISFINVMFV
jgi:hypothetical protein